MNSANQKLQLTKKATQNLLEITQNKVKPIAASQSMVKPSLFNMKKMEKVATKNTTFNNMFERRLNSLTQEGVQCQQERDLAEHTE